MSPSGHPSMIKRAMMEANKVHTLQIKEELIEFLRVLQTHKVRSVLEIGAYQGGTARAYLSLGMRVVSIDSSPTPELLKIHDPGWTYIKADSQDKATVEAVYRVFVHQKFDAVIIDGDHSERACENDYICYAPLARKLIAFHDITPTKQIPDVFKVWSEVRLKFDKVYEIKKAPPDHGHGWGVVVL